MTLIQAYIADCNYGYTEPERRGTQKGSEIGVFRGRHNAAMNSLYNYDLQELAERSEISYAFLRKLRTEKAFKDLTDQYRFYFLDMCLEPYLFSGNFMNRYMSNKFIGEKVTEYSSKSDYFFSDSEMYAPELKEAISRSILYHIKHKGLEKCLPASERLVALLSRWNAPELNKNIFLSLMHDGHEMITGVLQDAKASKDMRSKAVACSDLIFRVSQTL